MLLSNVTNDFVQIFWELFFLERDSVEIKITRPFPKLARRWKHTPHALHNRCHRWQEWSSKSDFEAEWLKSLAAHLCWPLLNPTHFWATAEHVPALRPPQLCSEMRELKSLLHHLCQSGVVVSHIKNMHKPSTRAELASCNLTTQAVT